MWTQGWAILRTGREVCALQYTDTERRGAFPVTMAPLFPPSPSRFQKINESSAQHQSNMQEHTNTSIFSHRTFVGC